jgi:hypothetical protein
LKSEIEKLKSKPQITSDSILSKTEFSGFKNKIDSLKVKERMINFANSSSKKLEIKSIVEFWIGIFNILLLGITIKYIKSKKKKSGSNKKKFDLDYKFDFENEKNNYKKKENTNVKTEFKHPDADVQKLIPFCTNIFTIIKNDS